jgi:hypothetical protein
LLANCFAEPRWIGRLAAEDPTESPAELPEGLRPLWERAGARLRLVDREQWPRPNDGWTDFRTDVDYQLVVRWRGSGNRWRLIGRVTDWKVKRTAEVLLPSAYERLDIWSTPLARHELDHLRIVCHPRVDSLLDTLVRELPSILIDQPPDHATAEQLIRELIDSRIDAVERLVLHVNQELDRQTEHGLRPIDSDWLSQVYSEHDLKRCEFPFLADVQELVRGKRYRELTVP